MPDNRLESLSVRRDRLRIDCWYKHTYICDLRRITAISSDDSDDLRSDFFRVLQRRHQIWANVLFKVAPAHRKDEDHVVGLEVAYFEPGGENGGPTLVVRAGGEFGNVVGGRIGFDTGDFAEIIHGM